MAAGGLENTVDDFFIHLLAILFSIAASIIVAFNFDVFVLTETVRIEPHSVTNGAVVLLLVVLLLLLLYAAEELPSNFTLSSQLLLPSITTVFIVHCWAWSFHCHTLHRIVLHRWARHVCLLLKQTLKFLSNVCILLILFWKIGLFRWCSLFQWTILLALVCEISHRMLSITIHLGLGTRNRGMHLLMKLVLLLLEL